MPPTPGNADGAATITAYVAVGSNIQPQRNIPRALELLIDQVQVTASSTFYRSAATGPYPPGKPPAAFANGVWQIRTHIGPRELKFNILRTIEGQLGRARDNDKFADRTIDLDLILYNRLTTDDGDLKIPDPGILRPFVAVPLLELAPDLVLPGMAEPLCRCISPEARAHLEPLARLTEMLRQILSVQGPPNEYRAC
jgi:2-amino-4-hydroxy-6-hydroxymethyldihydropteridine diphosphokinase